MIEYAREIPRDETREVIIKDGEPIGKIWGYYNNVTGQIGYQCSFKFGPLTEGHNYIHMGGIAYTKVDTMREAVKNARAEADRLNRAADIVEGELNREAGK